MKKYLLPMFAISCLLGGFIFIDKSLPPMVGLGIAMAFLGTFIILS